MRRRSLLMALILLCALAALMIPYWPLAAVVIAFAAFSGWWPLALGVGILADLLFGTPPGMLSAVLLPFTLAAIASTGLRWFFSRYFSLR